MSHPSAVMARRRVSTLVTIAASLAVLLPLLGCEKSYPELEGTYAGRFGIDKWAKVSSGARYLVCGGPGVIEITSTEGGIIAGSWDFGPDTTVASIGRSNCGEDWHYAGELSGWVRGGSEVILSFDYLGNDFLSEVFDAVFEERTGNAWPARTTGGSLTIAMYWRDCPASFASHWCISFHAWRK